MGTPTPLDEAPAGLAPGRTVLLKREDAHELGAFKWRGALPALESFKARGASTVVTASTGNHGAAVAWAAQRLGLEAVVFVPSAASRTKLARLEQLGADLRLVDGDFDRTKEQAGSFAVDQRLPYFEDGAEPAQYDGYGAIADEIVEQLGSPPGAVVVPVGNGALLGGIGRKLPGTLRVGVVAKEAPVMALSWEARGPVECDRCATCADGMAVRVAIPYAVEALNGAADRMLLVSEREIARSIVAFDEAGIRAEGAAAATLGAVHQLEDVDRMIVLVVTGRNIDHELLARARDDPESFPD